MPPHLRPSAGRRARWPRTCCHRRAAGSPGAVDGGGGDLQVLVYRCTLRLCWKQIVEGAWKGGGGWQPMGVDGTRACCSASDINCKCCFEELRCVETFAHGGVEGAASLGSKGGRRQGGGVEFGVPMHRQIAWRSGRRSCLARKHAAPGELGAVGVGPTFLGCGVDEAWLEETRWAVRDKGTWCHTHHVVDAAVPRADEVAAVAQQFGVAAAKDGGLRGST
eukprot:311822-Chlamydomonas_euryale.AAC.1